MTQEFGLEHLQPDPASVVTVGTFDGVHLGHRAVLSYLVERARAVGGKSVAITFDPHPRAVVWDANIPLLSTVAERAEKLEALGLDRMIVVPFTQEFARLSAEDFVRDLLVGRIGLREIVLGPDHGFGQGREGDVALMRVLGERYGFGVESVPEHLVEQNRVSSSAIRTLLSEVGDVGQAARLLGDDYSLSGKVVQGDRRGRTMGYPTANVDPDHPSKVIPRDGVYAVRVSRGTDRWAGMMNIGNRPTFQGAARRLEVHLFDFAGDLYGETLRVEFVERVRGEERFKDADALRRQLDEDAVLCRRFLMP